MKRIFIFLLCLLATVVGADRRGQLMEQRPPLSAGALTLVSYWPLDEASGSRADAKGANTLLQIGTANAAPGVITNAVTFVGDFVSAGRLRAEGSASLAYDSSAGMTVCGWFNISAAGCCDSSFIFDWVDDWAVSVIYEFSARIDHGGVVTFFVRDRVGGDSDLISVSFTGSTWTFFRVWFDPADGLIRLKINEGTTSVGSTPVGVNSTSVGWFGIFRPFDDTHYLVDEMGLWHGILSDADGTYLYNAGAGRTYPDVPHP